MDLRLTQMEILSIDSSYIKKNIIFSKKQIFQKKKEFLKEDGIFEKKTFFFFLHFQI